MKKREIKILKLRKKSIASITPFNTAEIKGGTEPVSVPMSQAPDDDNICYAIK